MFWSLFYSNLYNAAYYDNGNAFADGRINENSASYTAGFNANGDIVRTISFTVSRTLDEPSNPIRQIVKIVIKGDNGKTLYSGTLPDSWWQNTSSLSGSVKY